MEKKETKGRRNFDESSPLLIELFGFIHVKLPFLINSAEAEFCGFVFEVLVCA